MHLTKCEETNFEACVTKIIERILNEIRQNLLLEFQTPYLRFINLTLCDVS